VSGGGLARFKEHPMTQHRTFKQLVRTRMAKTGESYTAARAILLAGDGAAPAERPPLATSDAAIRERTGRGWEAWFDVLDGWGAAELPRREVGRRLAAELGLHPLAWNVQAIVSSFERARGLRAVGQHEDGFSATAQKTVAVPVEVLYEAFLADVETMARVRTATAPRSARFDWEDAGERLHATFAAKGAGAATVTVAHSRLADDARRTAVKAFWRERLAALAARCQEAVPARVSP
jgi:hypothetical protein